MTLKVQRKGPAIPQDILKEYFMLRNKRLDIELKLRKFRKREDDIKEIITDLLKSGVEPERGILTAYFKAGGRFPNWKEAFVETCGKEAAQQVVDSTPYRQELVVEGV